MTLSEKVRRKLAIMIVVVITIVASIPLFASYVVVGHDTLFHLFRIEGIADGIRRGQFPVRMQYTQLFGMGYPVSICYGDLFLYIPAVLNLLGFSVTRAYALFAILVNASTAAISYVCFKRIFSLRIVALAGCALWTLAPYRLSNMYVRGAAGEYMALVFIPMIVLGAYLIFTRRQDVQTRFGWIWCAVGIAGIVYSHVLSLLFVAIFCVFALVVGLVFKHDKQTLLSLLKAFVCTLLLAAAFLIPFADFMATNDLQMSLYEQERTPEIFEETSAQPAQLLMFAPEMAGRSMYLASGIAPDMPFNVGWAILGGALLWCGCAVCGLIDRKNRFRFTVAICLVVCSVLHLIMMTNIIPWGAFANEGVFSVLFALQFPFRFLGPLVAMLTFLGCMALEDLNRHSMSLTRICASVLLGVALLEGGLASTSVLTNSEDILFSFDSASEEIIDESRAGVMDGEYMPASIPLGTLPQERKSGSIKEAMVSETPSKDIVVNMRVGDEGGYITIPRLAYAQYQVFPQDDFKGSCTLFDLDGTEAVRFAPGSEGSVIVAFTPPLSWNVALGVSYVTVIGLVVYGIVMRRRHGTERERHPSSRSECATLDA